MQSLSNSEYRTFMGERRMTSSVFFEDLMQQWYHYWYHFVS